ncbi:response regulator transcription factor [Paenibacillus bovis]|uniref:DNA-binding response regulator n=1 Tax=Paenibacillus bovis TaxID=1616788 RepID=A0A172ZI69_9BACL|nr:response regulator [Paenibacillus bovis]ANF97335.1 DNA-binding response regulator [Paenibacillus bovis]
MYTVMIVEDEMLVRIGLKNSVDWNKFNMKVIADLPDGQSAWDSYKQEKPDLIITDIRMPRMDGMELISRIREEDKQTRIVVLSCLEEFDLARRAMSLGVSGYILKLTMTEEEIETVLSGIQHEWNEQQTATSERTGGSLLPANLELIKEKFLKDFLLYGIYSAEEWERFVVQSEMRLSPVRIVACTIEVDNYSRLKQKFKDEHGHLIKMTLLNILNEITSSVKRGEGFYVDETHYLLLLSFEDILSEQAIRQQIAHILQRLQEVIRTYFSSSVSVGISQIGSAYKSLPVLYHESCQVLSHKFWTGTGLHHVRGEQINLLAIESQLERIRQYAPVRELLSPLRQERYEDYIRILRSHLQDDRKSIQHLLFQFIQWVSTSLYDHHQNEKTLLFNITGQLEQCDTLPEMLDQVTEYLSEVVEYSRNLLYMSNEIARALQYIKQNYAQNISLQQVADHVNLSFGYLSNLFKKELQITFIDYLNRYRIERAKELLIGTNLKSYDIAVQVGFSPEYTYFSKVFKKVTGLNPNEYRRQWLSSAGAGGGTGASQSL